MTDIEERRAKQRERNRRWRERHPITDEERAKRRAYYKERNQKHEKERNCSARHSIDAPKRKTNVQRKKEKDQRKREDAEAKAMGISYGKYQMLKEQGKLPRYIPIPEKKKPKKLGVYIPAERGLKEFNESRERTFEVAAGRIMEERRQKRARIKAMDSTANNYTERMKRQKEAVERATAGSNQCDS